MANTMPKVVSPNAFHEARAALLVSEKAATRHLSALALQRRSLPCVPVPSPQSFTFTTPDNTTVTLLDLFANRRQLILYNFMLHDNDKEGCVGCSFFADHIPRELAHLESRDTSLVVVAPAGIEKVVAFKERMGWTFPFYSSKDTFTEADKANEDVTFRPRPGLFSLAVFLRPSIDSSDIYHTYSTTDRGVESVLSTYALLDMTPLGRQEEGTWEERRKFKLHDKY